MKLLGDVHIVADRGMLSIHHAATTKATSHKFLPDFLEERKVLSIMELLLLAFPQSAKTETSV